MVISEKILDRKVKNVILKLIWSFEVLNLLQVQMTPFSSSLGVGHQAERHLKLMLSYGSHSIRFTHLAIPSEKLKIMSQGTTDFISMLFIFCKDILQANFSLFIY